MVTVMELSFDIVICSPGHWGFLWAGSWFLGVVGESGMKWHKKSHSFLSNFSSEANL